LSFRRRIGRPRTMSTFYYIERVRIFVMEGAIPDTRAAEMATAADGGIDVPLEPILCTDAVNLRALRESKERYRTLPP
jgi:hypothetical protein